MPSAVDRCRMPFRDIWEPVTDSETPPVTWFSFIANAELGEEKTDIRQTTSVSEISKTGCYLDMMNPLPNGTPFCWSIAVGGELFQAQARIIYAVEHIGAGVQFEAIDSRSAPILERWLAETRRSSAGAKRPHATEETDCGLHRNPKANNVEPAATATYCFPSTEYVIGDANTLAPHWKCHRAFPFFASSAIKFPSASPVNTIPPAVESTPDQVGEPCFHSHTSFPVAGSSARSAPQKGWVASFGK